MANTIMTQEFAETVAFDTKVRLPGIADGRVMSKLSNRLESGSGSVVSVLVPGVNNVVKGSAVDGYTDTNQQGNATVNVQKVPVTVDQYNISAPYTLQDETLNLFTFQSQISEPNAIRLASDINTRVFDTIAGGACTAYVDPGTGGLGWKTLANAISTIKSARIGIKKSVMAHPNAIASIIGNSANSANLFQLKGEKLYEGEVGNYFGADVFDSPDAGTISISTALSFTVTAPTDGAKVLNVTAGGSNGLTVPKGTPFTITGYYSTDAFGKQLQLRTFVTSADYTFSGNSGALPVGPIYLTTGTWPIPNTILVGSGGTTAVCPLATGTVYAKALAYADRAGAFASITPSPFPGTNDSVTTSLDGELNVRSSFFSNLESGMIRWRFDVLYGVSSLYGNGAVMMYFPIA